MHDIQEIRENYRGFTDARILRIARQESKGLKKEVIPILMDELKRRDLGADLVKWVQAETRELSRQERTRLQEIIRTSVCERCDKNTDLQGYRYTTLVGALILSFDNSRTSIICSTCGGRDMKKSFYISLFFGWWSLPGIFKMPFLLVEKLNAYFRRDEVSDEIINALIDDHIGRITLSDDEEKEVRSLLHEFNQVEADQHSDLLM